MASWNTLNLVRGLGDSLGKPVNNLLSYDRNKRFSDLEEAGANEKLAASQSKRALGGQRLSLDASRLGFDMGKQEQDIQYKYDNLNDRGVGRREQRENIGLTGMNKVDPTFTFRALGGPEDVVSDSISRNRQRESSLSGAKAGATAAAKVGVKNRDEIAHEVSRRMGLPENAGKAAIDIYNALRTELGGVAIPNKPSGLKTDPEEALRRDKRASTRKLYDALATSKDKQGEYDATYGKGAAKKFLDANRWLTEGAVGPAAPAPSPPVPSAAPTEADLETRILQEAQSKGWGTDPAGWNEDMKAHLRSLAQ